MSSREKSPVKLDPEVYVKRSIVCPPKLIGNANAWFQAFP
jgi:hypothetical protein